MKFNNIILALTLEDCFLNEQGHISEMNAKCIDYLTKLEAKVVFTTRLPPHYLNMLNFNKVISGNITIIALDGALAYDYKTRNYHHYTAIEKHTATQFTTEIIDKYYDIGCEVYTHDGCFILNFSELSRRNFIKVGKSMVYSPIRMVENLKNWLRVSFTHPTRDVLDDVKSYIEENYGDSLKARFHDEITLDVCSINMNKSDMMFKLAGSMGWFEDLIFPICGTETDKEFFQRFPKCFCTQNAPKELHELAFQVLPDNNKPVLYYIREYLDTFY